MPTRLAVMYWMNRIPGFQERIENAKKIGSNSMAEQEVGQACAVKRPQDVPAARLALDARKWYTSEISPEVYGDKVAAKVDIGFEMLGERLDAAIAKQRAKVVDVDPEPVALPDWSNLPDKV
jgi:hypothetical protein